MVSLKFRTKIEIYGHFRTLLRPSNFELRDFSYKTNSFPMLIYEDLSLKAADVLQYDGF